MLLQTKMPFTLLFDIQNLRTKVQILSHVRYLISASDTGTRVTRVSMYKKALWPLLSALEQWPEGLLIHLDPRNPRQYIPLGDQLYLAITLGPRCARPSSDGQVQLVTSGYISRITALDQIPDMTHTKIHEHSCHMPYAICLYLPSGMTVDIFIKS